MSNALIGKKLGEYDIQSLLGEGGMAKVYKGYDERLDRYAAIKVILPNQLATDEQAEYGERFLREARAIAKLHHPNIVSVYQFGELDNLYYMAMMFVEGRDLRHILKETHRRGQTLPHDQILRIISDIAGALDYSHQQGVIHRDIKPSNIMVTSDGKSVLTDFGLALSTQEGTIGNTFGSVHYIAPEQAISSADSVSQSDLYSLGVVLYELLTGKVPFDDASAMSVALKHISDPPPPASTRNPDLGMAIEEVLNKILDKDPKRRFATGEALVKALEEALTINDTQRQLNIRQTSLAKIVSNYHEQQKIGIGLSDSWDDLTEPDHIGDTAHHTPHDTESDPILLTTLDATSAKRKSQTLSAVPQEESGTDRRWLIGLLLLLFVGAGIALFASGIFNSDDAPTVSQPTLIASGASSTPAPTDQPTDAPPATVDSQPTDAPIVIESDPTDAPTVQPTATDQPTVAPTEPATSTATDSATDTPIIETALSPNSADDFNATSADEPDILLYYTSSQFIIYNRGTESYNLDVRRLSFFNEATSSDFTSDQWTFRAARWRMRPQLDCFQLIDGDLFSFDKPDFCPFLQAFERQRSPFWRAPTPTLTFDVHWDGAKIASCPVVALDDDDNAQQCLVNTPN